jgi:hypothetical protein
MGRVKIKTKPRRRYLGTWTLPSGNSCNVYWTPPHGLACEWDHAPSPTWPAEDRAHWQQVSFPEICRAVAQITGSPVLGVSA